MPDQLGFELYSAREFPPLADRIAELKTLGYGFVEPYGALLAQGGGELKQALAASGLKAPTTHVALDALRNDLHGTVATLKAIGVDPAWQGRGAAGLLLRSRLRRCDQDGQPAYLEVSQPGGVALYERFGFKRIGHLDMPAGAPVLTGMWRIPAS